MKSVGPLCVGGSTLIEWWNRRDRMRNEAGRLNLRWRQWMLVLHTEKRAGESRTNWVTGTAKMRDFWLLSGTIYI